MDKKRALIGILVALSFILLIISVIMYIEASKDIRRLDPLELESMSKEDIIQNIYDRQAKGNISFYYFIPMFAFFGIAVGALMYYLFAGELERKQEVIKNNSEVILKLLAPEERKVIQKLVEGGGKAQQSEITYMEGYTKVKAHRIIESLVKKGIVEKEALGKMRLIKLKNEFYEVLK